jgi:hypothetical protein
MTLAAGLLSLLGTLPWEGVGQSATKLSFKHSSLFLKQCFMIGVAKYLSFLCPSLLLDQYVRFTPRRFAVICPLIYFHRSSILCTVEQVLFASPQVILFRSRRHALYQPS